MLFGIDSTYLWLGLAIALALLELSTATLVCIWFVIGALMAFGISFVSDSVLLQVVVFAVVSGGALAVTRPLVKKYLVKKPVPTNADMLPGTLCLVTQDITPDRKGRVQVGDIGWMAQSDTELKAGEKAVILSFAGATLTVAPAKEKVVQ